MGGRLHGNTWKLSPAPGTPSATGATVAAVPDAGATALLFTPDSSTGPGSDGKGRGACHQRTCPSIGSEALQLSDLG